MLVCDRISLLIQPVLEKRHSRIMFKKIGFSLALVCLANVAVKQVILTIIINHLSWNSSSVDTKLCGILFGYVWRHKLNLETVPTHTVRVSLQLQLGSSYAASLRIV